MHGIKNPQLVFNEKSRTGIVTLAHLGVGGQKGFVYSTDGLICTLPATQYKDPPKVLVKK